ncbi:MAG: sulfatase-like hydrolase/transferase [Vicinamibacterales bacterium]
MPPRARTLRLLAALAACAWPLGALTYTATPPNILLVTIDTLRADRVGAYGDEDAVTPTLDGLAARGVRFADAVAHVPLTFPSHVSLLTSRYPGAFGIRLNGAPVLPAQAVTVAERLKAAGYRTGAFVGAAVLDAGYGLDQGFDVYDDDFAAPAGDQVALAELQRPAGAVVAPALRWIQQGSGPWFAWVHLYDPHLPYDAPADWQRKVPGRLYDAEVAYADAMVGRLLQAVRLDDTFVVVTSDHGEALGDHGERDHGYFIYDSTLHVPMIAAGGGLTPRVVDEQVRIVDVAPTLLALAGAGALDTPDGESLVPLMRGQARRDVPPSLAESWYPRLHFGWSELRGVRVGEFLYIAAPRPELYDLRVDPAQQKNIVDTRAVVASRLAAELATLTRREQGTARPPAAAPDPETVRRLQALGYVGTLAPVTGTPGEDPKDHLDDYLAYRDLLNRALGQLERGRATAAIPLFRKLLDLNVRAFEAHLYLGNAYAAAGQPDAALGEYAAALQLNPDVTLPRFETAKVLAMQGDIDAAVRAAREGLAREPRSFYGWYTLGVIYQRAGRLREAATALATAVDANPREPRARANLAEAALKSGDLAMARRQFEAMISLGHRPAPAHFNLGLMDLRAGDRAGAERHFRAALAADPTFTPAADALKRLEPGGRR